MTRDFSPSDKDRLDFINPRITDRIVRAREGRMAKIVKRLRVWLPLGAVAIIVLLFLWPTIRPNFTIENIAKNIPDLVIDNLNYSGVDDKDQPYSLLAKQATKPSGETGIYEMVQPEGEITLQNGTWIDGKADFGRYDEEAKKIQLTGNVRIFRNDGLQVTTNEAHVDLNTNDVWGDKNVLIQGGFGTLRGEGFQAREEGDLLVIKGPAKAILHLQRKVNSGTSSLP